MLRKGILFVLLVVIGIVIYNYIYQDHRDISSEKPDFEMLSQDIASQFSSQAAQSEKVYIDKTIQIEGAITELNESDLTIDDAVFCQFNTTTLSALAVGKNIRVKGRCIGFDDLLEQVKLNECTIIE